MKTTLLLLLAAVANAAAQYTIDWSTMDGGGGSGAHGGYVLAGTLGQLDAVSGVGFFGGYWSLENDPLPRLRIFLAQQNVVLAWPNPSTGFTLQASPGLLPTSWNDVALAPTVEGDELRVIWGPPGGNYFFRLRRP